MVSYTANLPDDSLPSVLNAAMTGVYYGYAQVTPPEGTSIPEQDTRVLPMVMSFGWNPFYKNERMTAVSFILYSLNYSP